MPPILGLAIFGGVSTLTFMKSSASTPLSAFDAMLRELLESEAVFLKAIWRIDH